MPRAYAVLGAKVAAELFPDGDAPGSLLRAGDRRFRVAGVLAPKGQFLGFDLDDMIHLPAAHAQALFNRGAAGRSTSSMAPGGRRPDLGPDPAGADARHGAGLYPHLPAGHAGEPRQDTLHRQSWRWAGSASSRC